MCMVHVCVLCVCLCNVKESRCGKHVFKPCPKPSVIYFKQCFEQSLTACFSVLKKCVKVGEGVYGEVFRTKHNGQSVALKVSFFCQWNHLYHQKIM